MNLATFQNKAIGQLLDAMETNCRDIVLKSCTGSGKTIILTHFMDEYSRGHSRHVFIWLTPGKGDLELQSYNKMNRYIHNAQTKLLCDVMTGGFESGDVCFINWEKLTKKGNNALKEGERTNFKEHVEKALNNGLRFSVIVDESHQNDTVKAADILSMFQTEKIIRSSATPKGYTNATVVDIPDENVVAEGLIKKLLVINENFPREIQVDNQTSFLLEQAYSKQRELYTAFVQQGTDVNPLIIVQLPNNSGSLQEEVETWFESQGITYENGLLAVWLSDQKQNLEEIENCNAKPIAVLIKQAIATGWDCPRASILVKLRQNMDETFEVQTIGRIRRMPEAKHYDVTLLDNCYLYTLDEKFTQGVKTYLGKGAMDAQTLVLKDQYQHFSLKSQQVSGLAPEPDPWQTMRVIHRFYETFFSIDGKTVENKKKFEARGYVFDSDIVSHTRTGEIPNMTQAAFNSLNTVNLKETLSTHKFGREFHHNVALIARKIGLKYEQFNAIVRKLFCSQPRYEHKILLLNIRELYSFVINNADRLKHDILSATAQTLYAPIEEQTISETIFKFPPTCLFTYNGSARTQEIYEKNVYQNYRSSAEPRSEPERKFERFCQESSAVKWFYKNGDKGSEFLSIVYTDATGHLRLFYPDYVVNTLSGVWILETKGGFSRSGSSEDIDRFSPLKFKALQEYVTKYALKGGLVREDKLSQKLYVCTDDYSDDINSPCWRLLEEALREN